jgi:hypothetical protein
MRKHVPQRTADEVANAILLAQQHCLAVGLTSVCDAGLQQSQIEILAALHQQHALHMRVAAMVDGTHDSTVLHYINSGPLLGEKLIVRAMKFYADGALGSRGARLLEPYSDDPDNSGLLIHTEDYFLNAALSCFYAGFQMCSHAIGDSANRMVLDVYGSVLKGRNDLRWRIEHCQVVHPDDLQKFSDYSVIPSVQTTHATSDMYWADERLGANRVQYAYAYKTLKEYAGTLANGSDFPVESINPLLGFFAAISRKDLTGFPAGGFQAENALSREDALRAMTIWAAHACFMEQFAGSLETGKRADFVMLDTDLMQTEEMDLPAAKVLATYIDGNAVFTREP